MENDIATKIDDLYSLIKSQEESMEILLSNYEHLKKRVTEIELFLHRKTKTSRCC